MESELRMLLKNEYGFKENHLVLIDFLLKNKGRRFSAEELWNKTEVPQGRIYDFLNDLTDWGFLDVEYTKPKTYAARALKDALQSVIKMKERKLTEVEKRTIEIANKFERYLETDVGRKNKVLVISGAESFYLKARELLMDSLDVRISVRVPELFIVSERSTTWGRRYYESLVEQTQGRRLRVKYLFSLKNLLEEAGKIESVDEVIKSIENVFENQNMVCRFAEHSDIENMLIAENRVLIGFVSPKEGSVTIGLYLESPETVKTLEQIYDRLFGEAEPLSRRILERFVR